MGKSRSLFEQISLLLIICGAFALRAYGLGAQELSGDEAFGYFMSQRSFSGIVAATLSLREPHPVASYFVQKVWLVCAGDTEFALRLLSVCWDVLAVALLYRLGRKLGLTRTISLLGAGLLALSPYSVWHGQNARMYSMSLTLTIASTCLALQLVRRRRWFDIVAYVLVSLLALHTHYYTAYVLLAQNVFVLTWAWWQPRECMSTGPWFLAQGLLVLGYSPWLWQARYALASYAGTGDSPAIPQMLYRSVSAFLVGSNAPLHYQPFLVVLAAGLVLLGLAQLAWVDPRQRSAAWLLLLYQVTPLAFVWIGAMQRPIFNERYLLVASPPFYLLLAAGVAAPDGLLLHSVHALQAARWRIVARLVQALLLTALLSVMFVFLRLLYTDPAYSKNRGWRELARTLERLSSGARADQVYLLQNFPDPTLWYYYRGPVAHEVLPPSAHDAAGSLRLVQELAVAGVQRVVLIVQPVGWWDDQKVAQTALLQDYTLVAEERVTVWAIQIYTRVPEADMTTVHTVFGNKLTLEAVQVQPSPGTGCAAPGGMIAVHMKWRGQVEALTGTEKIFLHLLDINGVIVAQTDPFLGPADLTVPSSAYGILLPDALPPGTYRLIAGVYDSALPGSPRLLTTDGDDHVELGMLCVEAPSSANRA